MRPPTPLIGFVAGALLGGSAAGLGLWLGSPEPPPSPAAIATSPAPAVPVTSVGPAPTWVESGEAVLGPTVLVPVELSVETGEAVLRYDLIDIAPPPRGTFTGDSADPEAIAAPERWTLVTTQGDIPGTVATTRARAARFEVGDGFDLGTVLGARIDSWRIRMPYLHLVDVPQDAATPIEIDDGITLALKNVLVQSNSTIVQLRVEHPIDGFSAATGSFSAGFEAMPQLSGRGPDWTNVGPSDDGVQLTFVGNRLPDPIPLAVRTHEWVTLARPVDVDLTEVLDG